LFSLGVIPHESPTRYHFSRIHSCREHCRHGAVSDSATTRRRERKCSGASRSQGARHSLSASGHQAGCIPDSGFWRAASTGHRAPDGSSDTLSFRVDLGLCRHRAIHHRSRSLQQHDESMAREAQTVATPTPNHAMERTAARRTFTSFVARTFSLRSMLALGGGRSSCSR
jgi:hypothetical protein